MKAFLLLTLMLLPFAASADFIARCDPMQGKTADQAATTTAKAVIRHLRNIDQIRAGVEAKKRVLPSFDEEGSTAIIAGHSRMCYQFFRPGSTTACDYTIPAQSTPFPAPAVCAWSKLKAADQARVRALNVGP